MKIHFRQTGGFAGLNLGCDLDTAELPRRDANKLTQLVRDSRLTPGRQRGSEAARDLATYEITVEEEDRTFTTSFDDMSLPEHAEGLVDFLRARARPQPFE